MKWACNELESGHFGDLTTLFHGDLDLWGRWDTAFRDTFADTLSSFETEATKKEVFGSDDFFHLILDEELKKWSDMSLGMSKLAEINPFAHLKRELPKIVVSFEVPRRPEHALAFAMVRC